MDLGYCREGGDGDDLARQLDAIRGAAVPAERIYVDAKPGHGGQRDGFNALLRAAKPGDRVTLARLDRLGCSLRETLSLAGDLSERGIFLRTLDPALALDTSVPGPATDMALAMLVRLATLGRDYRSEHAATARAARPARRPVRDRREVRSEPVPAATLPRVGALPPRLV
ncbi:recombinase family protein [Streptacidiphilus jiangxiensis]|uniref:Resolvase, N terminal domain n=1 Tax=Streptacidiphilus jiangxiensis TaxID=235985 RepID=A0A1H7P901_STRJI|nr:recombinase family protein [Streptacidiphilus jiangxiensis]SEL32290.1 Resolvase, N terminal domain [Streptacidiphilus jiangxiensis]